MVKMDGTGAEYSTSFAKICYTISIMPLIGISLGFLPKLGFSLTEALNLAKRHRISAVEIPHSFLTQEIPRSIAYFQWVSVHGEFLPYEKTFAAKIKQDDLLKLHAKRPINLVVFHPDQITDFRPFGVLPFPVAFENSDQHKACFQTSDEFRKIFEGNFSADFKLTLDINHTYANDPTLILVKDFYTQWESRIAEIHLSGYRMIHDPLFRTQQEEIIRAIKKPPPPIILEGIGTPEEIEPELTYVRSFF